MHGTIGSTRIAMVALAISTDLCFSAAFKQLEAAGATRIFKEVITNAGNRKIKEECTTHVLDNALLLGRCMPAWLNIRS